ncbi:MAG TPA: hypothetical protein VGR71_17930 [Nitrospira sp.]|nr:hypothetical protein [Nitrospira sp.]
MRKKGILKSLNVSPKGSYEGLLLAVGRQIIQVNFPKDEAHGLGVKWVAESTLTVEVIPEKRNGSPEHEVFKFLRFLGVDDGTLTTRRDRFSGTVERLNYALHGEVNGGILDSGDFLHLKPEGAAALGLKCGMAVEGRGAMKPMVDGHSVIEAEEVNGIAIGHKKAKKKRTK